MAAPERRVVLLGASNLVRGISTVVEAAWHAWGRPLDVLAALGHGRSYGARSQVLVRALPGIAECGLWTELAMRSRLPTAALVTDIGNDLLYGAAVEQIVNWVETCLDRLAEQEAKVAMTLLPLGNLETLTERRFRLFRTLLFPACRLSLDDVCGRAAELNERVRKLGVSRGIPLVDPRTQWYGFDPIHIQLPHWSTAWREILGSWSSRDDTTIARGSFARWVRLRSLAPEQRWICGISQRRAQPAAQLRDGTTISFY